MNALVAPIIFRRIWEYPLLMILACAVRPVVTCSDRDRATIMEKTALAIGYWSNYGGTDLCPCEVPRPRSRSPFSAYRRCSLTGLSNALINLLWACAAMLRGQQPLRNSSGTNPVYRTGLFWRVARHHGSPGEISPDCPRQYRPRSPERRPRLRAEEPLSYYHRTGPVGTGCCRLEWRFCPAACGGHWIGCRRIGLLRAAVTRLDVLRNRPRRPPHRGRSTILYVSTTLFTRRETEYHPG